MFALIRTTTSVVLLLLTHKEEKGANGGRFSQLLPGTSIHPTQQLACLLYVARPTTQHSRRRQGDSSSAPCVPRAAAAHCAAPHTVRQGGGGGVHASPIRQKPALARGISHRSRRSMATTTLQKGNEKNLVQKNEWSYTNRIHSSVIDSEWIRFIYYFILQYCCF